MTKRIVGRNQLYCDFFLDAYMSICPLTKKIRNTLPKNATLNPLKKFQRDQTFET